jgi:hypothetical protein
MNMCGAGAVAGCGRFFVIMSCTFETFASACWIAEGWGI